MDAGVLVIDRDEEIFRVVRELVGGLCPVVYAADADAALAVMQAREIGVVITDIDAGHGQLTEMLKILKHENPQILTIVATTASDSELVIELINEAQIFRFLNRPVNVKLLKGHVHSALQRYLTTSKSPILVEAHPRAAAGPGTFVGRPAHSRRHQSVARTLVRQQQPFVTARGPGSAR